MRSRVVGSVMVVLACAIAQADDAPWKKTAVEQARRINQAVQDGDFAAVADLTHPNLADRMGGRDKMIASLKAGAAEMKATGRSLVSFQVGEPTGSSQSGRDLFVVVPLLLEMKSTGGKMIKSTYLIGVSGNGGKEWTFVSGRPDVTSLKAILPNFPDGFELPAETAPIFEPD